MRACTLSPLSNVKDRHSLRWIKGLLYLRLSRYRDWFGWWGEEGPVGQPAHHQQGGEAGEQLQARSYLIQSTTGYYTTNIDV